jgi:hypothetical protein
MPAPPDNKASASIGVGRALIIYVGCALIFVTLGPFIGGVPLMLVLGAGSAAIGSVGLTLSFFFGVVFAAIAGQLYALALTGLLYSRKGRALASSERVHLRLGWQLGAACGAAPVLGLTVVSMFGGSGGGAGAALLLSLVAALAGACCGRLCSAWAIGMNKARAWVVLAALLVINGVVYMPYLVKPQIENMAQRLTEPGKRTGTKELVTYQEDQTSQRCGGAREPGAPFCDNFLTKGGTTVWKVPAAVLSGESTSGFTVTAALPGTASENALEPVRIQIRNRRVGTYYWERAVTGDYFSATDVELLPDRARGLLHFRSRKANHCTLRDQILQVPARAKAYESVLAQSQDPYVCWPTGEEFFVSPSGADPPRVFIRCPVPALDGGGGACDVQTEFRGWLVEYWVPGSRRHEWPDYDRRVRPFLETLVHEECDAPTWNTTHVPFYRWQLRNCRTPAVQTFPRK